jgi:hypothetical protein
MWGSCPDEWLKNIAQARTPAPGHLTLGKTEALEGDTATAKSRASLQADWFWS